MSTPFTAHKKLFILCKYVICFQMKGAITVTSSFQVWIFFITYGIFSVQRKSCLLALRANRFPVCPVDSVHHLPPMDKQIS